MRQREDPRCGQSRDDALHNSAEAENSVSNSLHFNLFLIQTHESKSARGSGSFAPPAHPPARASSPSGSGVARTRDESRIRSVSSSSNPRPASRRTGSRASAQTRRSRRRRGTPATPVGSPSRPVGEQIRSGDLCCNGEDGRKEREGSGATEGGDVKGGVEDADHVVESLKVASTRRASASQAQPRLDKLSLTKRTENFPRPGSRTPGRSGPQTPATEAPVARLGDADRVRTRPRVNPRRAARQQPSR